MNARSSPSATMAAMMALKTNAAGPSLQSFSKMDPIAHSKNHVCPVLRSFLVACKSRQVLPVRNLQPQSAAVSLRRKTSNLIHDGKVFRARGKGNISGNLSVAPMRQGKSDACDSRGPPLRIRARKRAPRAGGSEGKGPAPWKVHECRAV